MNSPDRSAGEGWDQYRFGFDEDLRPSRLKHALEMALVEVPEVDEVSLGPVRAASFLKWDTGDDDGFGHVWIDAEHSIAGWWTSHEGAQRFRWMEPLGGTAGWRLHYENGYLEIRIASAETISGKWYKQSEQQTYPVEGTLEGGHVSL